MAWVSDPTNQLMLHFLDDAGRHATMSFDIANTETNPAAGAPAAISNATAFLSNSALYQTEVLIRAHNTAPGSPLTGPYDRPADKVSFTMIGSDGSRPTLEIGGPLAGIFGNDAWNVDFTNGVVIAFVNGMIANARTASGGTIASVTRGQRRRPPRRKGQ